MSIKRPVKAGEDGGSYLEVLQPGQQHSRGSSRAAGGGGQCQAGVAAAAVLGSVWTLTDLVQSSAHDNTDRETRDQRRGRRTHELCVLHVPLTS